ETCKDGADGYRAAAEDVQDSSLKALFTQLAAQRGQFMTELQGIVAGMGEQPERSGSVLAAAHRGWINLKSAVASRDDVAILAECERGDEAAVTAYENAMRAALPSNVLDVVQRQGMDVRAAYERVRTLEVARS
ncbi:MAG: PA2169 family four-helix-bundle protein, partial [Gemmatimonadaceae bacterium]|nr:PA2169 family four-helix-bundle protein [Gemmatimonadaceae bacterium]